MLNWNLKERVKCNRCHEWEYWGDMTWKDGHEYCRDCYSMLTTKKHHQYTDEERVELCR